MADYAPREPRSLSIDSVERPKLFLRDNRLFDPAYFHEAGFSLPTTIASQSAGAKSLPLSLIEHGATVAKVQETLLNGRKCLLLELTDNELSMRFYLDPACGHAVRRREEVTHSGRTTVVSMMGDFVQFNAADIWLPKRCDVDYYTWPTKPGTFSQRPLARRTFVVHEINRRPFPSGRVAIDSSIPGTHVADSTLPQAKQMRNGIVRYVVPDDPDDLDAAIRAAASRRPFFPKGLKVSNAKTPVTLGLLDEGQRSLIQSMTAAAANGSAARLRIAVFDDGNADTDKLPRFFDKEPAHVQQSVNSADIRAGALERFNVVIFPGGKAGRQAEALGEKGKQAVQQFVRVGGGYVGICAGSFLATHIPQGSLGIVDTRPSTSTTVGWVKLELTEVGKSILGEYPGLVAAEYGAGPVFLSVGESSRLTYVPLAFYRTEVSAKIKERTLADTPAIVAARFGKGCVLLFSVHPEGLDDLRPLVRRAILSVAIQ